MIGVQKAEKLYLHHHLENDLQEEIGLKDHKTGKNIKNTEEFPIPNILSISEANILILDSSAVYQLKDFNPDLILLRDSPKVNLERLIQHLNPRMIIADGSNYHTYVDLWRKTAEKQKSRFHHTGKNGSFRISTEP